MDITTNDIYCLLVEYVMDFSQVEVPPLVIKKMGAHDLSCSVESASHTLMPLHTEDSMGVTETAKH